MQTTITKLEKGTAKIDFTVEPSEIKNDLENAAKKISEERLIQGFRPGKASYDVVKNKYGEMAIYEAALGDIVRRAYVKTILEKEIDIFGEPSVNVTTLAPGNAIAFSATVSIVPKPLSLPDIGAHKVTTKTIAIEDKDIDKALQELTRMQTKELHVDRAAKQGDKLIVDMDLSFEGVPLEGGQARNHGIFLDEDYYIPGMRDQVIGMEKNQSRTFTLKFPETHFQKHIAGKDVQFAVTAKGVYELVPPALDDAFAKTLGQPTVAALRDILRDNMKAEASDKERQRVELEVLDKLVEKTKFEDIPEAMINAEIDRMIEELKMSITERGGDFDQYLAGIKKTIADLKMEFVTQAMKRIKTALLIRAYGQRENIEVSDEDVLAEQQRLLNVYADDAEVQKRLRSEDYTEYLRTTLKNRKVVKLLTDAALN